MLYKQFLIEVHSIKSDHVAAIENHITVSSLAKGRPVVQAGTGARLQMQQQQQQQQSLNDVDGGRFAICCQ